MSDNASPCGPPQRVLAEADWTRRERAHRPRVDAFVGERRIGAPNPRWDFLFNVAPRHGRATPPN